MFIKKEKFLSPIHRQHTQSRCIPFSGSCVYLDPWTGVWEAGGLVQLHDATRSELETPESHRRLSAGYSGREARSVTYDTETVEVLTMMRRRGGPQTKS